MLSKKEPAFQAVAVSNSDENEQQHNNGRRRNWTPGATKPPLLVALLCFVLALIVVLQVASSRTVDTHHLTSELSHAIAKRQEVYSTQIFTGFQETITGTTITWQPTTATYPTVTYTYGLSTQTITGTTESEPGYTSTIYETVETIAGTPATRIYELVTTGGSVSTQYMTFVGTMTSAAYLDTSTPDSIITTSSPTPYASVASEPVTSAMPSDAYLEPSAASPATTPLSPTSPSTTSPIPTSSQLPSVTLPVFDRIVKGDYTTARYYIATYLPSILVILLKILWSHVFASVKLIEPFHQLSSRNGATSSSSLLADYLSPSISFSSLTGLLGHPTMLLTTTTTALTTVLAPLAAESMAIRGSANCPSDDAAGYRSCAPVWTLNMICIRVCQALLAMIFILIMIYTLISLRRRNTGVHSDPSSINTVSGLLGNQEFVHELLSVPPNASKSQTKKALAGNRYTLASYPNPASDNIHGESYGIITINNNLPPNYHLQPPTQASLNPTAHPHSSSSSAKSSRALAPTIALLAVSLTLFGLILGYWLDPNPDSFNNFLSSNTFGPRFMLSALASVLCHLSQRLEREVRVYTPWQSILQSTSSLSETNSKARRAMRRGLPLTAYSSFPSSLWHLQPSLAFLSFVTILGDVLIIAVPGVPYADAELWTSLRTSVWLSISILCLMMVSGTVAGLWLWRWERKNLEGGRVGVVPDTLYGAARWCLDLGLDRDSSGRRGVPREVKGEAAPLMVEQGRTFPERDGF